MRITQPDHLDWPRLVGAISAWERRVLSGEKFANYYCAHVQDRLATPGFSLLDLGADHYAQVRRLDVAADYFGLPVWQLDWVVNLRDPFEPDARRCNLLVDYVRDLGARLLLSKVDQKFLPTIHALESLGFRFYGGNHIYRIKRFLPIGRELPPTLQAILGDGGGVDLLHDLVCRKFQDGHYFADRRLDPATAKAFFARIITDYYQKQPQDFLLFFKGERFLGFTFLKPLPDLNAYLSRPIAQIEYTAIEDSARVYADSIFNAMETFYFARNPGPLVTEIAINNNPSWRVMTQAGSNTLFTSYIFHLWLD